MPSRLIYRWTKDEHRLFERLLAQHGTDFKKIAGLIPNRSYSQVRSHYYNDQKSKLGLQDLSSHESPVQNDTIPMTPRIPQANQSGVETQQNESLVKQLVNDSSFFSMFVMFE
ncbi:Conserved_hypothetical protein [Hexamita inflata]|uniref:Myb-like DNA-binding domain containing protein n=1 Tax=Hexamita inflata TaxID=28002 RepID=A0ABP1HBQ8_9EUKA